MAHRVAVAVSGGRDSTALLHCTLRSAAPLGVEVLALHVHHGLLPAADAWLKQVGGQARRWGAVFDSRRLAGAPARGDSVEAWARRERYRALAEMAAAHDCNLVLLAHHRRDQAETWLLQALRGGGPRGLAAMPAVASREGIVWARPWLAQPREAIEAYVQRHRLRHVDDASNDDPRFARNALRLQVWPALRSAFPQAETALATAARQAWQAAALADEAAAADLPALQRGDALDIAAWRALPPARRRNALRAWLAGRHGVPARVPALPESLLQRLCDELPASGSARWPACDGELRLYRGLLSLKPSVAAALQPAGGATGPQPCIDLSHVGRMPLPGWAGEFIVEPVRQGGAPAALLRALQARERQGGERFRLAPGGSARSLKKQFQALAVPAWDRCGPLLFTREGGLVFVPGLGIDAALRAAPGEPQLALRWRTSASSGQDKAAG